MTARLRGRDGQAGITVVEMTAVVALLGLVLALAFQSLSAYQRAAGGSEARQRSLEEARNMMAVLTKDLRTATDFESSLGSSQRDVLFKANLNTAANALEKQVHLYVDTNDRLREDVRPVDTPVTNPPTWTGPWTSRVVGQSVAPGTAMFDFLDEGGGSTDDEDEVVSVEITLSVDVPSATPAPGTVLTSQVFLPNLATSTEEE
jgi:type II secretory pathway pseudopilin PulG